MNADNGTDNNGTDNNGTDINGTDNNGAGNDGADNGLDPLARLHAADPAADVEPRAGFVDEVLARTVEASAAGAPASVDAGGTAGESAGAPVHDLASERARRRPRWLPIAAVAASIAIVGGAGFGLGATASGTSNLADSAAPPISVQSGSGAPEGAALGGAVGAQQKLAAGRASDMMFPSWGFGRNEFHSTGLATQAGNAPGYTFDARSSANAETVNALGAALGLAGTAELKDGSWVLGPQDQTAPALWVSLDAGFSFYFNNPGINPWQCGVVLEAGGASAPCEPPASLPSEDAAIDALRSLITATGRDAAAFEFTTETWDGAFTRTAQAWPVVDGQRIDQSWSIELTDAGIVSVSGALAQIVPLGDYAIASEQEAFERLSDPRFGAQMTAMPAAMRAQQEGAGQQETQEWVPPTEPPATPTAGTSLSWPVNRVEIVSARLGLTSQWQPDGSVLIVPAYEFTDADGGTWSVIAVADSMLDFAGN